MPELLVFLVILFSLFGVVSTQYIGQYRRAYEMWLCEIVFNNRESDPGKKINLCSQIESYSRELCEMNDLLSILISMTYFALISIGAALVLTMPEKTKPEYFIQIVSFIFVLMVFFAIPILLYYLKIYISNPSGSSSIDNMLFSIWWKHKCHRSKIKSYPKNAQPSQLYELLAEKIQKGEVTDATEEEKKLVEKFMKDINRNP